jgi:hypothetical protein
VWVLRVEDPAVRDRRDVVADALSAWIVPFSRETPHVTVWVRGWEPPPAVPAARVTVEVGRVNAFASCVFLEVRCPAIRELRATMPPGEARWGGYVPHLTVGRFPEDHATGPIVAALRPFRRLAPVRVTADLVAARVDAWAEDGDLTFEG